MYFIIIHSINFDGFLSVKMILDKKKNKVCCIVICYYELKLKNIKRPIKKLKPEVQVK